MSRFLPETDKGRSLLLGLVLVMAGLSIGLPPVAWWGPGAALAVPGLLFMSLAFAPPPTEGDR